jgi:predicted HAD superfamily Cof-like phosphohydrolase
MNQHQKNINKFMKLAGQEVPEKPTMPNHATRVLRAQLILEECMETISALGFDLFMKVSVSQDPPLHYPVELGNITFINNDKENLEEIIDGVADISVVSIGTASACGVDMEDILEEVDQNNLAKFGPGGYRDENGKWRKPPDHKRPDISGIIESQIRKHNAGKSQLEIFKEAKD